MAAVYPTNTPVTASALWAEISAIAETGEAESEMVSWTGTEWQLAAEATADAKQMAAVFLPLLGPVPSNRPMVIAHLAQSLDGRIARADGESHWITGEGDLDHTHRLRAISDAVLVGAHTVHFDDCQLTVRRCSGCHPVRVVVDPVGRLSADRRIFQDGEAKTIWIVGQGHTPSDVMGSVEVVSLPSEEGHIESSAVLQVLHERGIRRLFVEGGGVTVSHFLRGAVLDRLHLAVAPLLIGEGRSTLTAHLGSELADCPRPTVRVYPMGDDWLFDCAFEEAAG